MIASGTALLYICIGLYFLYCLFYQITGFSVPLKKEHEENRRKKEEEQDQMWRDIKPIYSTLESQTIIVRGLRPKTPWTEQLTVPPPPPKTSRLNLTHFEWVRFTRLISTDPKIIFLFYPLGLNSMMIFTKNCCTIYVRLGK